VLSFAPQRLLRAALPHESQNSISPVEIASCAIVAWQKLQCYNRIMNKNSVVQDLFRHVVPDGDAAVIFDRALTLLLQELEREKLAHAVRPRDRSDMDITGRHVPAAVRRKVWARDGGQCAFVGADGRCSERGFLEFHHLIPFAEGGLTTVENLQLRCRAHNAYEARAYFGPPLLRESSVSYELGPDRVHGWHNIRAAWPPAGRMRREEHLSHLVVADGRLSVKAFLAHALGHVACRWMGTLC
jgi:hypothetical protein